MGSFDRPADVNIPPSGWVVRFAALIRPGGKVLDLAAGHGRHGRFFLDRGCEVVATDIDTSHLNDLAERGAQIVEADLENGPWPFADTMFDAIIVCNYLYRPHFPLLAKGLQTGGILLFDTFGQGNETVGRPRNPDFLLAPGELLSAFGHCLRIVAYEHGLEEKPRLAVKQRLCAQKMSDNEETNRLSAG